MLPGSANASSRAAVDAAAVDVVAICYDVAEIKPDAEPNALFLRLGLGSDGIPTWRHVMLV